MRSNHAVDMTVGHPMKKMVTFAIPLLLGNIFQQFYNTADSIIVGRLLGTKALAAVGAGFPFMAIMFALFMGLGMASTIMVSQAVGARRYDRVNMIFNTIYRFSFTIVIPLSLIGIFSVGHVLEFMNVPDDGTLALAKQYMQVVFSGVFAAIGYNTNAGFLQGLGDSITSLKLLILSTFVNLGLDLLFVGPLGMGVRGAALATIIAQSLSWILGILIINKRYDFMKIDFKNMPFHKDIFKEALRLGIPGALQNALFSIGSMAMMALINSYGSAFMAGFNSANKIDLLVFLPIQSFANATTTYTGQNIGANKFHRVQEGLKSSLILTAGIGLTTAFVTYPLIPYLLRLFGDDPAMIEAGHIYLRTILPFYFILAFLFTFNGMLRGAGQANIPLISSLVSLLGVRVPIAYYLAANFGKKYIYFSYPIGWVLGTTISAGFFFFGKWRKELRMEMQAGLEEEVETV